MKLLLLKENDFCILRFLENANAKKCKKNAKKMQCEIFFQKIKKNIFRTMGKRILFMIVKKIFPIQRYIRKIPTEII